MCSSEVSIRKRRIMGVLGVGGVVLEKEKGRTLGVLCSSKEDRCHLLRKNPYSRHVERQSRWFEKPMFAPPTWGQGAIVPCGVWGKTPQIESNKPRQDRIQDQKR